MPNFRPSTATLAKAVDLPSFDSMTNGELTLDPSRRQSDLKMFFSDAEDALQEMDGRVLDGRELR